MTRMPSFGSVLSRVKTGAADPVRDWFVLISVFGIALAALVVWHVWAFDTVAGGGTLGGGSQSTVLPLDRASLTSIRAIFENRATEAAKYQTGVYRFADPSQ